MNLTLKVWRQKGPKDKGQIVDYKVTDISEQLNLSPKTVNSYRYRLFSKLDISGDVELTHLAIRHGMLDTETL